MKTTSLSFHCAFTAFWIMLPFSSTTGVAAEKLFSTDFLLLYSKTHFIISIRKKKAVRFIHVWASSRPVSLTVSYVSFAAQAMGVNGVAQGSPYLFIKLRITPEPRTGIESGDCQRFLYHTKSITVPKPCVCVCVWSLVIEASNSVLGNSWKPL